MQSTTNLGNLIRRMTLDYPPLAVPLLARGGGARVASLRHCLRLFCFFPHVLVPLLVRASSTTLARPVPLLVRVAALSSTLNLVLILARITTHTALQPQRVRNGSSVVRMRVIRVPNDFVWAPRTQLCSRFGRKGRPRTQS